MVVVGILGSKRQAFGTTARPFRPTSKLLLVSQVPAEHLPYEKSGLVHRGSIYEKIVLAQRFVSGSRGVPMPTECSATLFEFARVEGRSVVGAFDGGKITSDAGALLLAATDRAVGLIDRFAGCFTDSRSPELVEHTVATLVGQRMNHGNDPSPITSARQAAEALFAPKPEAERQPISDPGQPVAARKSPMASCDIFKLGPQNPQCPGQGAGYWRFPP